MWPGGDIFNLSELWVPHLKNSDNNNPVLRGVGRLNEINTSTTFMTEAGPQ